MERSRHVATSHLDKVSRFIFFYFTITNCDKILSKSLVSIEADVVVIASCIPTLQPLLEYFVQKSKGSSYNNKYFNRIDKNSSNQNNSRSIEMRAHRSQRSKQHSISITNIERGDGSEENILETAGEPHQIRRTDDVTIQYESRHDEASKSGSWYK